MLDEDLIQYYQFLADKGDVQAQVGCQLFVEVNIHFYIIHTPSYNYWSLL